MEIEQILSYEFKDKNLLKEALTHSSVNQEKVNKTKDNERLEFLGDAFLDAIIGAELYLKLPNNVSEGTLTKKRAQIVCEKALVIVAKKLGIKEYIQTGDSILINSNSSKSILADTMEAIIGAIYLDGGFEKAKEFVLSKFDDLIKVCLNGDLFTDYKTKFQELVQKNYINSKITYTVVDEEGPDNNKIFTVQLKLDKSIMGKAKGRTKKEAEQNAAKLAINNLKKEL